MSARALTILAICTLIGVLSATWAINHEWSRWGAQEHGAKIFPNLTDRVETVERILVDHANGRMTIKRTADGWVLEESDDHKVHGKTVQRVLFVLAQMQRLEPKTERKQQLARLQLEDPTSKDAKSKRVQVLDNQGKTLADLIVGKENLMLQVIGEGGVYIREQGQPRAWLASGDLTVGAEPKDWLRNRIMDIARTRINRATVTHPDGETLTVVSDLNNKDNFVLEGLQSNEKLQSEYYPADIARALADLEMLDARKRDKIAFKKDKTIKAAFHTGDGLTIRLELTTIGKRDWMRVSSITATDSGPATDMKALEKEIAELTAQTKDWVYSLPEFESVHLKKRRAEVVETVKAGS